jgi:uncharacterized protein
MEPEAKPSLSPPPQPDRDRSLASAPANVTPEPEPGDGLQWIFLGSNGLRSGWSATLFLALLISFAMLLGSFFSALHLLGRKGDTSPRAGFFSELILVLSMLGAGWIVARVEGRRLLDYNLTGPGRLSRFGAGIAAGFIALSALIAALDWGGWLQFGGVALSGTHVISYAAGWTAVFLLVGCFEEGSMRCFLLFTLARGINFWWAIGIVGSICGWLLLKAEGEGAWGVYALALLGLAPCIVLFLRKARCAGFWYAAWVTSTFFAFGHTGNNGENWIGIFAAGAIGFVFCVSVRVTGSAWWAIGCHAAWDWAETYFYGTADSGIVAQGHYLTTSPAGAAFWSGGTDGPEGSVLVLAVILLLLLTVLALYGRRRTETPAMKVIEQAAG